VNSSPHSEPPLAELPKTLVVASHNQGKVREINDLLSPLGIETKGAAELGLIEPEETEDTFAGNAELKARAAADVSGLPALADDSGLAVAALNGAPGIFSARWAGPNKSFAFAMARVENELRRRQAKDLSAKFVCALALALPHGECQIFEGEVEGKLVFPGRGSKGFGYDPIFIASGMSKTFGEMEPEAKHAMSHRAKAFAKLLAHFAPQDA
jgi:XTP/dITP diphosphohydrolase